MNLQEVLENAKNDFEYFSVCTKKIGLKESIKKTQEVQFGVNLTPKKELKTKKEFLDALNHLQTCLSNRTLGFDGEEEEDRLINKQISVFNSELDEADSLIDDVKKIIKGLEFLD